ncbi:MAG: CDP-diacylglycerol--glycerol-3-phosphate 3-phosphatidyltransferase [Ignavibacteriales bacterium]|nr:CDP-diacylglycerol--glycerol-3-phosphate 3-phosphatidyltransferase [Ignavibacteriales bacterium]
MTLPNQLTILRILLTPVFIYFFLTEGAYYKEIALGVFGVAALTDWYDGWLARKFNYISDWGKFMDPLADKILTAGAFFSFVALGVLPLWAVVVVVSRDVVITLLRGYAEWRGISFKTSHYAKWKTFIQMAFLYYLLMVFVFANNAYFDRNHGPLFDALLNEDLIYYTFLVITFITVHTGALYFYKNWEALKALFRSKREPL